MRNRTTKNVMTFFLIIAIRLLDIDFPATASQEALALTYKLDAIDIYSNSWGPRDDGKGFDQTDALQEVLIAALNEGITKVDSFINCTPFYKRLV